MKAAGGLRKIEIERERESKKEKESERERGGGGKEKGEPDETCVVCGIELPPPNHFFMPAVSDLGIPLRCPSWSTIVRIRRSM